MKSFLLLSYFLISIFVVYAQKNNLELAINKPVPASIDSGIEHLKGYALIITERKDYSEVAATREFIIKQGGSIAIIGSKNVMIGWIDPSITNQLIGQHGIVAITYKPVDIGSLKTNDRQTIQTVTFFNSVTSSNLKKQLGAGESRSLKKMDYFDALPHPEIVYDDYLRNLKKNKLNIENLNTKNKILRVKSDGALITGNSDKMVGTVTVAVFMVESNGSIDPDLYTWSTADEDSMYQRTLKDLSWWAGMAMKYGKALTFNVIPHYHTDTICQQPYEPILHSSFEDSLWIGSIMNKLGFTEGIHTTRVEAYNTWLRVTYNTDWAYSIFFAYNPSTAPYSFTNGYGGYANLSGPYTQILFQWFNNGSPTVTHETGHIFGALDEYYLPGYGGCGGGAFNNTGNGFPNGNCELSNVNSVDCMMKENSNALCAYTPAHIGWVNKVSEIAMETNPTGLNISVEDVQKISPLSFPWGRGTAVNISVVTPQTFNGKTYDFLSWSDGGAQSHSITVPDSTTTYTANFSQTGEAPQNWLLYQQSNALPSAYIHAVTFDKQGEMWVGTGGGLSKFDGKKWTTYNTANSGIPTNYVTSVFIDLQGNKWIGTEPYYDGSTYSGGGLAKFDGATWTVYTTSNSGLPSNNVTSIAIDGSGNKWIGTDAGLVKFDGTSWIVINNLPTKNINAIVIDKSGNKWIGTEFGLAKFDGTNMTIYNKFNSGLPDNDVSSIAIDDSGNKWIGTSYGGLGKFNDTNWTVYTTSNSGIPDNEVRTISIDGAGNKWIGTWGGLAKLEGDTWYVYTHSNSGLPENNVRSIAIDSSGNKWIGTANSGLAEFDDKNWSVFTYKNLELLDNRVTTIAIDSAGNKWIGTGGGLGKFDGSAWMDYTTSNSGLPFFYVSSIGIDGSGNKWIGTWDGGLAKFDGTTWTVYNTSNSGLPDNMVMALTLDNSGNKWIGTLSGGLAKFDGTTWTVYNTSNSGLPNNDVWSIAIDHSGNKWIGTIAGLAKYDGKTWTVYNTSNSGLPDNYVNSIAIDGSGNKWVGVSNGGGLAKFDDTNWTIYNNSNSLIPSNNSINSIAVDHLGNIWIGTNGLIKFDGTTWTVYTSSNSGLPINYVMALTVDGSGNKWIGTNNGLAIFNEEGIVSLKDTLGNDFAGELVLFQNFPNPFSSSTNIRFNLQAKSFVSLKVFDLEGREVATIVSEEMSAGIHLLQWNSSTLPSGIYLCQLRTDSFTRTKKLILKGK
ncbi:MAG: two-component regulator propeller domain-containing protein [Paludibacter sp.]|nr:two-component regulator propeller domain-containing protein [Paludibacter sp.]